MDGRSFANNFEDYCLSNRTQYLSENGETLNDHWSSRIRDCIYYLTPLWINAIRNDSENDFLFIQESVDMHYFITICTRS
ncbi:Alpha,alpha-trehalose-phosphate synthase [Trichinella spiralis]|uniref:Alpha,alpha-trehalose-phosphate synthase n=1 Tax=Trichinella spiralis TaxID=6334 RepID=A0ABR3KQH0_TRISP